MPDPAPPADGPAPGGAAPPFPAAAAARAPRARAAPGHRPGSCLALMVAVAVLVVTADAVSKALVLSHLAGQPPVRLLGGLITLSLTFNAGAAFSLGTSYTVIITLFVCGVIAIVMHTARRLRSLAWSAGFGLLLGGAAGNLGDRLFRAPGPMRGRVIDWINLPHFPWTFNLADSSITCAAVLIALLALRGLRLDGTLASTAPSAPAREHVAEPDPMQHP
jgi:signal peptidase II